MKVKLESEKVGLKLEIQKTKIMVSGPISLWQIDGEQWTSLELGRKYSKAVYHHLAYLIYMQSISCKMHLDEAQAGIKIAGKNINNLRYTDDTTIMEESEE